MALIKQLGKNTLGDGDKMNIAMKTYDRSTHNKSYAWRSTMGVGTLVPSLKLLGLPGDTFDIEIDTSVFTNPTVGPLFGNYKLQIDVFTCPMRLYIAQLHNNAIGVAMKMHNVKMPQLEFLVKPSDNPTKEEKFKAINPSSVMAYLGKRGFSYKTNPSGESELVNALPLLMYWDIFANYYVNKQEENYYAIISDIKSLTWTDSCIYDGVTGCIKKGGTIVLNLGNETDVKNNDFTIITEDGSKIQNNLIIRYATRTSGGSSIKYEFTSDTCALWNNKGNNIKAVIKGNGEFLKMKSYKLESLNDIREDLLKQGRNQKIYKAQASGEAPNPIIDLLGRTTEGNLKTSGIQSGLAIKTYQADIFTNYVNSSRITEVANASKVITSDGSFTIDALNLSQKKYNYLQRLAATNGDYKDWVEVSYTSNYGMRTETPIYEGGLSDTIVFESVVNTAQSEENPLGELGGRGRLAGNRKGGRIHINCTEPCYIIGIASITPLVDYSEGNDWDVNLDNMGQLHVPEYDGIGFEDIKTNQVAYWVQKNMSYGKTTAWQNYMTNYNRVFGSFAIPNNMAHMVLNRYFDTGAYDNNQANVSTYINPEAFNYNFAIKDISAQNFQVQIGWGVKARRKMSARQLPRV